MTGRLSTRLRLTETEVDRLLQPGDVVLADDGNYLEAFYALRDRGATAPGRIRGLPDSGRRGLPRPLAKKRILAPVIGVIRAQAASGQAFGLSLSSMLSAGQAPRLPANDNLGSP